MSHASDDRKTIAKLRLMELFFFGDEEPLEVVLSALVLVLGVWLILPFDTFGTMTTYRPLRAAGVPEWAVGWVMTALGSARLYLIATNRYRPRQLLAIAIAGLWGYNALL